MTAPHLNRKVILEARSLTPDGAGGQVAGWAALGTLWAELRGATGTLVNTAEGATSSTRVLVTVRGAPVGSDARPKPGQRFRDGSQIFQIKAVTERDAKGRHLICTTTQEHAP